MPNHVTNIIEIKGAPTRIKALFEAVKNDEYGIGCDTFLSEKLRHRFN